MMKVLCLLAALFLAAGSFAQIQQCGTEAGTVTLDIPGTSAKLTMPMNGKITFACPQCCDRMVIAGLPPGATVTLKYALTWVYTGATGASSVCMGPPRSYLLPATIAANWMPRIPDRDNFDYKEVPCTAGPSGTCTFNICYPSDRETWKSPEIHVDYRISIANSAGVPLITNWDGGGSGWDPLCSSSGCTLGFWKTHPELWTALNNAKFATIFGVTPSRDVTLLQGLNLQGGGENALIRDAVAAYLNSLYPSLSCAGWTLGYQYNTAQVTAKVQAAYASRMFEAAKNDFSTYNETLCRADGSARWYGYGASGCSAASSKFCSYWLSKGVPLF